MKILCTNYGGGMDKMAESKLYHCCNTCEHKDDSFYGCKKANECYNGFSAYSPNPEMKAQDEKFKV